MVVKECTSFSILKAQLGPFYTSTQLVLTTFRLHVTVSNIFRGGGGNCLFPSQS